MAVRPKMEQNCFGTEHTVILRHNGINREPSPPARMIAHRSFEFVLSLQFMLQLQTVIRLRYPKASVGDCCSIGLPRCERKIAATLDLSKSVPCRLSLFSGLG